MNRDAKTTPKQDLNSIVDRFEVRWIEAGSADIQQYLPPPGSPNLTGVLCELIRLDLEFRWKKGEQPRVEDYLERFADVTFTIDETEQLAFEEYRVQFQSGQSATPGDYEKRFGIDTTMWPTWSSLDQAASVPNANGINRTSFGSGSGSIDFPEVGSKFHGFDIVGQLGQGAFGCVFLARQEDLANRFVALKVTEESETEPQSLARLQHTNIIPIYSLKKEGNLQSICMPFLGVATMRDLLAQTAQQHSLDQDGKELISTVAGRRTDTIVATVDETESRELDSVLHRGSIHGESMQAIAGFDFQQTALWMAGRVADGLAYAHSKGIVHGDLKPANVLISDDGEPLILDFHLARAGQISQADSLVGGTMPYMSATHLRSLLGKSAIDAACDVFSLGVILYEALTGVLPFEVRGDDDLALEQMIHDRQKPPVPIRQHNSEISRDVQSIVECCLAPEGRLRYDSARELQTDIERHLSDLPLKFAPNRSWFQRSKKWIKRHPRVSSATSIAVLAMLAVTIAGTLVAGRLSHAEQIEIENESARFVETVTAARVQLASRHEQAGNLEDSIKRTAQIVNSRTATDSDGYVARLFRLPTAQRNKEVSALGAAEYWIAYRMLNLADTTSDQNEQARILDDAVSQLDFVVAVSGDQAPPAILQLKADLLERQGHFDRAEKLRLEILPSRRLATIPERLLQAAELRRNNDDLAAIAVLVKLVGEQPDIAQAWLMMGQAYSRMKEFAKAEVCYSTCIELDPGASWGYFHRGFNYLLQRKYGAAIPDFDKAIERSPSDSSSYLNRALARIGSNQLESAVEDLTVAIENGAIETRAYYLRYQVFTKLGKTDQAKFDFNQFLELEPQDEISWLSRGMAHMKQNNPVAALSDFESALRMNPKSVNAFQNVATVQAEFLDQTQDALAALTEIINLEPNNLVALATRGVLRGRLGQRDAALADAKLVLMKSRTADILFRAAGIFALTSRQEKRDAGIAVDLLKKASFKDPQLVWGRITADSDLEPIRENEEYKMLVKTLRSLVPEKRD